MNSVNCREKNLFLAYKGIYNISIKKTPFGHFVTNRQNTLTNTKKIKTKKTRPLGMKPPPDGLLS